jgi:hypothetical protein
MRSQVEKRNKVLEIVVEAILLQSHKDFGWIVSMFDDFMENEA